METASAKTLAAAAVTFDPCFRPFVQMKDLRISLKPRTIVPALPKLPNPACVAMELWTNEAAQRYAADWSRWPVTNLILEILCKFVKQFQQCTG
mmetsp:Transcript_2644/g.5550  ORF Transcript_2644/g.5550 Transcript_2644/m.5550 type:complete len:94 (+) Transcript_2644:2243-2524(+)